MERVSDEWLNEVIPKYSAIDSKSKGGNVYLALCELRERRQNEIKEQQEIEKLKSASEKECAGATHNDPEKVRRREEAIYNFWDNVAGMYSAGPCRKCLVANACSRDGYCGGPSCAIAFRKKYESIAGANVLPGNDAPEENTVLPIPCTKGFENWTVKQWFAKINEELDELKEVLLRWSDLDSVKLDTDYVEEEDYKTIADEGADTITAITSMLEAMGIDERQRQEAQRRVNERNAERKRL